MRKVIVGIICIIIGIIFLFIVKIPKYVELNGLIIVEGIGVECRDGRYKIHMKEIIPLKDDTGISYKYKVYSSEEENDLERAYKTIEDKTSKKIFYKDSKYVITNCVKSDKIVDYFSVKPNYIEHTKKDIYKTLKKK